MNRKKFNEKTSNAKTLLLRLKGDGRSFITMQLLSPVVSLPILVMSSTNSDFIEI